MACEQFSYTYSTLYKPFIELIENGKPISVYGDGSIIRDYTYIDDIIDGICSSINYTLQDYEIINLDGGSPISLKNMICAIEKIIGKKAKLIKLPMQLGDVNKTISDIINY